jgi:hypothetical protein
LKEFINKPVMLPYKLYWAAAEAAEDPEIKSLIEEIRWRSATFDSLRNAMRIALPGGTNGLNDEGSTNIISIREGVMKFRKSLEQNEQLASDPLCGKMGEQIDKYLDQLFNDPIMVDTPSGSVVLHPQRTNNILEHFFRELSRENRRKTGNNSKQRMLKNMLADTPLVKNLANPDYMSLLLNGKTDLEQLFASESHFLKQRTPIRRRSYPPRVSKNHKGSGIAGLFYQAGGR